MKEIVPLEVELANHDATGYYKATTLWGLSSKYMVGRRENQVFNDIIDCNYLLSLQRLAGWSWFHAGSD